MRGSQGPGWAAAMLDAKSRFIWQPKIEGGGGSEQLVVARLVFATCERRQPDKAFDAA